MMTTIEAAHAEFYTGCAFFVGPKEIDAIVADRNTGHFRVSIDGQTYIYAGSFTVLKLTAQEMKRRDANRAAAQKDLEAMQAFAADLGRTL